MCVCVCVDTKSVWCDVVCGIIILSCFSSQLYPKYVQGEPGVTNTDDGEVVVQDTPLLLGSSLPGHTQPPHPSSSSVFKQQQPPASSPPVGLMLFVDHTGSQDNSQSCEQEQLSCDETNKTDDLLIMGSLLEIGGGDRGEGHGWKLHHKEKVDKDLVCSPDLTLLKQLDTEASPRHTHHRPGASGKAVKSGDRQRWYADGDEEDRTASGSVFLRKQSPTRGSSSDKEPVRRDGGRPPCYSSCS